MNKLPTCYAIIPARYDSSRFPGKPLAEIFNKPMYWHVFQKAKSCSFIKEVILATDDQRILDSAKEYGVPAVLTRHTHQSGTDRIFEACQITGIPQEAVVINIQGDEPTLIPEMLDQLIEPFSQKSVQITTLIRNISAQEARDPDIVKVVCSHYGTALYFSRAKIPHTTNDETIQYWGHIGLYAFRLPILKKFVSMEPGPLEKAEKLEQLRLLENGIPIHVRATGHKTHGVDRPEDIEKVEKLLADNERI